MIKVVSAIQPTQADPGKQPDQQYQRFMVAGLAAVALLIILGRSLLHGLGTAAYHLWLHARHLFWPFFVLALFVAGGLVASRLASRKRRRLALKTVEFVLGRDGADPHQVIGALDSIYAQLRQRIRVLRWFLGQDHVVFTIARDKRNVMRFYLTAPANHIEALCGRLQSTYPNMTYQDAQLGTKAWAYRYQMRLERWDHYTHTLKTFKDYALSPVESLLAAWARQPVGGEVQLQLILTPRPLSDEAKMRRRSEHYQKHELSIQHADPVDPGIGYVEDRTLKAALESLGRGVFAAEIRVYGDTRDLCKAGTAAMSELSGSNRLIEARIFLPGFSRLWLLWQGQQMPSLTDWLLVFQRCLVASPHVAAMWHLPDIRLRGVEVNRSMVRRSLAVDKLPRDEKTAIVYDERGPVSIPHSERKYGVVDLGLQGTGKSTDMIWGFYSDMAERLPDGRPRKCGVILDPKGDLAKDLLGHIPEDIPLKFATFRDTEPHCVGLNPFARVTSKDVLVSDVLAAMKAGLEAGAIGSRSDSFLRNAMYAILETHGSAANFPLVYRMLSDAKFREEVAKKVKAPFQKLYWNVTFPSMAKNPQFLEEALSAPRNKIERLISVEGISRILAHPQPLDLHDFLLNKHGWLVVDMAKADVGEDNVAVAGNLILAACWQVIKSQAAVPKKQRVQCAVYVDEVHNLATPSWITMIAEGRGLGLEPWVAYQFRSQIKDEVVRDTFESLLQNILLHRTQDLEDAEHYAQSLMRGYSGMLNVSREVQDRYTFGPDDIMNLPNHTVVARLVANGEPQPAFFGRLKNPEDLYSDDLAIKNELRTREASVAVDILPMPDGEAEEGGQGGNEAPGSGSKRSKAPKTKSAAGGRQPADQQLAVLPAPDHHADSTEAQEDPANTGTDQEGIVAEFWHSIAEQLERPNEVDAIRAIVEECDGDEELVQKAVAMMLNNANYHPTKVRDPLRTFRTFLGNLTGKGVGRRVLDGNNSAVSPAEEEAPDSGRGAGQSE